MSPLESRAGSIIVLNLDDNSVCRRDFLGCRTSAWHCFWSTRALWSWTTRHIRSLWLQAVIFLRSSQTLIFTVPKMSSIPPLFTFSPRSSRYLVSYSLGTLSTLILNQAALLSLFSVKLPTSPLPLHVYCVLICKGESKLTKSSSRTP